MCGQTKRKIFIALASFRPIFFRMADTTIKLNRKQGLYLKDTKARGRGVFCTQTVRKGEILETTPAILLNDAEARHTDKTILQDYVFEIGSISAALRKRLRVKSTDDAHCVVMGILSYCNHDEEPNAEILWMESKGSLYYMLRAVKNIPKNVEIVTGYGDGWFDDRR